MNDPNDMFLTGSKLPRELVARAIWKLEDGYWESLNDLDDAVQHTIEGSGWTLYEWESAEMSSSL